MAKPKHLVHVPLFTTILLIASTIKESQAYSTTVSAPPPPPPGREKLTHLHFYFHDSISGNQRSAFKVADAGAVTNASATFFGLVAVIDDPLTDGPDISSKPVGRAQGIYASADQQENGLLMVINYLFTEGEFSGSYVSLYGRNAILSPVREMPIVGGSGAFRFARGYALAKTYTFDSKNGNAVVEYDMYIWHY